MKTYFKFGSWILIFVAFFGAFSNIWIVSTTSSQIYQSIDELPSQPVALVLGTSYRTLEGLDNPYFTLRIQKAADLYKAGKVERLILSGANQSRFYNEPKQMKSMLVKLGVPDTVIILDHLGLRTLDSVVRCKEEFGGNNVIIITQQFHAYRALFISNYYDMHAIAIPTERVNQKRLYSVLIREYLARPMAIIDLYLLKTKPKHQNP